jgi:hypothetical protein
MNPLGMEKRKEKKHTVDKAYREKNQEQSKEYRHEWGAKDVECPNCEAALTQN